MDKELKQLERRRAKVAKRLAELELNIAKKWYKDGLKGRIVLITGEVFITHNYKTFKKWYKTYSKLDAIDEIIYTEVQQ